MGSEHIIALYERQAESWVDARMQEANFYEQAWLDRFCSLMPRAGKVLDCGCGAGAPIAAYLSGRGFAVLGVDASPAMIGMFKARLPEQRALVADMRTIALAEQFQGILAWDSFFHLNHEDQRQMFAIFRVHALPGTALMFTTGTSHGEAIGQLQGEPLYHASLDAAEYRRLLEDHDFTIVATVAKDPDCGDRTVWLARSR